MIKKLTLAFVSLFAIFSLFSCKKETVVQGNDSAYSMFAYVSPNDWTWDPSSKLFYYDVSVSGKLPLDFDYSIDGVLVYGGTTISPSDPGGIVYPLMGNGTIINNISYYYGADENQIIRLFAAPIDGSQKLPTSYMFFNFVFVQPSDLGSIQHINKNNYLEVKDFFHLK